ncbi:thermonuclease family protein [Devosia pacifica]|uniref:thermonuclease family protein n=1 Tax=Devosia pacifica TaxID=1335967 RepID=UPI001AEEB0E9|nr:thermonuclease family protein [Devosia pacifica]
MNLFRLLIRVFFPRRSSASQPAPTPMRPYRAPSRPRPRPQPRQAATPLTLKGPCWVIDGDTIIIDNVRIRLAGIDAPELDHPWGKRSKWALVELCRGQQITAHLRPEQSYDRVVAQCFLPDGRDLAAELVSNGLALDWPKFSGGKYADLEPADARRKLWRAHARQGAGMKSSIKKDTPGATHTGRDG